MRQGFDNKKYIELQAANIRKRIAQFGGKLYLEFGGKLFDDYPRRRACCPASKPDFQDSACSRASPTTSRSIIAINANHIEKTKVRGDLGITYDEDVLRLIDIFRSRGFHVGSVVLTQYAGSLPRTPIVGASTSSASPATCTTPSQATPTTSSTLSPMDGCRSTGATTTSSPRARSNRPCGVYRHVNARQRTIGYYNVSKCETRRSHETVPSPTRRQT